MPLMFNTILLDAWISLADVRLHYQCHDFKQFSHNKQPKYQNLLAHKDLPRQKI